MEGSTINVDDIPNTFKNYYFAASSDDETENAFTIVESDQKSPKRAGSDNGIDQFFDTPKIKKQKKVQSSTVGMARNGGVSYISSNTNDAANATHLVKVEVYDLKKLAKVSSNNHWKHADVRAKYYTKVTDNVYDRSKELIYDITKNVSQSQDCKKYFFDN
ncbi:hypothetical protein O0L34_g15659 [Tuta absoluta]|nr:hypothetical protein O0L34_g15659 [Tuta absoluta]